MPQSKDSHARHVSEGPERTWAVLDRGGVREVRSVARLRILKASSCTSSNIRCRYLMYRRLPCCQPMHCKSGRKRSFETGFVREALQSTPSFHVLISILLRLSCSCCLHLVLSVSSFLRGRATRQINASQKMASLLEGGNQP